MDVERYTGSCLISTALRPKAKLVQQQQQQRGVDVGGASAAGAGAYGHSDARNWAGVPLVSMAASIRKGGAGGGTGKGGGAGDWRGGGVRRYQGAPLIRAPAAPANKNGAKKMERRAPAAVVAGRTQRQGASACAAEWAGSTRGHGDVSLGARLGVAPARGA